MPKRTSAKSVFPKLLQSCQMHRDLEVRRGSSHVWPDGREMLGIAWQSNVKIAIAHLQSNFPEVEVVDRSNDIGYVGLCIEDMHFWVPAPLMQFLPDPDDLVNLQKAAEEARLFSDSRMCLSGSTVLTGALNSVGDLDLFEYVNEDNVRNALTDISPKYRQGTFICTELNYAKTEGKFPTHVGQRKELKEDHIRPEKMRTFAAKYLEEFDFIKIDMIGIFNGQVGEVTNISWKHPHDWNYQPPFPSFTYQEVVTGEKMPTNGAYSLSNFSRYVFWLREEVEEKLETIITELDRRRALTSVNKKIAIKLSKRAVSLAAMLGESELVSRFLDVLKSKEAQEYSLTSTSRVIAALVAGDEAAKVMAREATFWINQKLDELEESDPPHLDVEELRNASSELINRFDQLCYPDA